MIRKHNKSALFHAKPGFTIVELLIVIIVIAVLAAITIVAYNGIANRANTAAILSDLSQASKKLSTYKTTSSSETFPTALGDAGVTSAPSVSGSTYTYNRSSNGTAFCLAAVYRGISYVTSNNLLTPTTGVCEGEVAVTGDGILANIIPLKTISSGDRHTCVIRGSQVLCWGWNAFGQIGNGLTANATTAVNIASSGSLAGKTVQEVAMGGFFSCALASGAPYCWGNGDSGQMGNGTTVGSYTPIPVTTSGVLNGKTLRTISVGPHKACVVGDGKVYCWGQGTSGQLGDGTGGTQVLPVEVDSTGALSGKTVTAVSAEGFRHACALADGKPYCWGYNSSSNLGDGTSTQRNSPVAVNTSGVLNGKTATAIATAPWGSHVCVIADGSLYCWGANNVGQLGDGTTTQRSTPVAVSTSGVLSGKTISAVALGGSHTCALADGAVYCWGDNSLGQIGDGTNTQRTSPVAVTTSGALNGKTIKAISAGGGHTCAIATDNSAHCWGYNDNSQLGNGNTTNQTLPVTLTLP